MARRPRIGQRHNPDRHTTQRTSVQLPASPDEIRRWRALASSNDVPLGRWLIEAARSYEIISSRQDALTDEEWSKVVRYGA